MIHTLSFRHLFISTILILSFLGAQVCSALEHAAVPLNISTDSPPIKYDNVVETVTINGALYQVPEPYTGNRLFPTYLPLEKLKQIPEQYTHNKSKLYVLDKAHLPLLNMLEKAKEDGIEMKIDSSYRSKNYQERIFQRMLTNGRNFDDIVRYVAPPGYSQHMLGTALDFHPSNWSFADTVQYRWLLENGNELGFEQTYSKYNRYKMPWESWHWNYVGNNLIEQQMMAESPPEKEQKAVAKSLPVEEQKVVVKSPPVEQQKAMVKSPPVEEQKVVVKSLPVEEQKVVVKSLPVEQQKATAESTPVEENQEMSDIGYEEYAR